MKKATLLLFSLLLLGCVLPNQKISTWQMGPTLTFDGFSIKRPSDKRWYVNLAEQRNSYTIWRIDTKSPTHTMYTIAWLEKIAIEPTSQDELEKYVKKDLTTMNPRNELIDYKSSQSLFQGQWCINFTVKTRDLAAANSNEPLIMTMDGFVVLHPSGSRAVVTAYTSQRGKAEELSPELDAVGEELLKGLTLIPVPEKKAQ